MPDQQLTLVLVRHGHVEGIHPERFRGRIDLPLTELGYAQAQATAQYIASKWPVCAVYSSPLSRCMETARLIAEQQSLSAEPLETLLDIDYGPWQGQAREAVRAKQPELFKAWMKRPHLTVIGGAETLQDVSARAIRALAYLRESHPKGVIVAVSHDSTNRVLLTQAFELSLSRYWDIQQAPCAINVMTFGANGCRIVTINTTAHLDAIPDFRKNGGK